MHECGQVDGQDNDEEKSSQKQSGNPGILTDQKGNSGCYQRCSGKVNPENMVRYEGRNGILKSGAIQKMVNAEKANNQSI